MTRQKSPYERHGIYKPESEATIQVHTFTQGETLSGIAQKYYGDWREWRRIADRNNINDPRVIATGTELIIPSLPLPILPTE